MGNEVYKAFFRSEVVAKLTFGLASTRSSDVTP